MNREQRFCMDSQQRQLTLNKDNRQRVKIMYSENRQCAIKKTMDIEQRQQTVNKDNRHGKKIHTENRQMYKKTKKINNIQFTWTMDIE